MPRGRQPGAAAELPPAERVGSAGTPANRCPDEMPWWTAREVATVLKKSTGVIHYICKALEIPKKKHGMKRMAYQLSLTDVKMIQNYIAGNYQTRNHQEKVRELVRALGLRGDS